MTGPVEWRDFERAVFGSRFDDAGDLLAGLLDAIKASGGRLQGVSAEEGICTVATRITAAVTSLFLSPDWRPSELQHRRIARSRPVLTHIAGASAFGSMDHVLEALANNEVAASDEAARVDKVAKMLLAYDLNSGIDFPFERFARLLPQAAMAVYFPLLGDPVVATDRARSARQRLLDLAPLFKNLDLPAYLIGPLTDAWFSCSYDDRDDKHEFKAVLNGIVRRWLDRAVLPAEVPERAPITDRPTVLVAADVFKSTHALYRCYAPLIAGLKPDFRIAIMTAPGRIDAAACHLADEVIRVDFDPSDAARLVRRVRRAAPDVIFFPSVGMSHWTVTLANTRCAGIQIASQGHPATTRSDTIDYVVTEEKFAGDPRCYSERLVFLEDGGLQFQPHPGAGSPTPNVRRQPDVVRVAVNSLAPKLSAPFLRLCAAVQEQSSRPLEFHFFAGQGPLSTEYLRRNVAAIIAGATVHPWSDFEQYQQRLSECDLQLATFPFGGTNTIGDSLALGLPVVARRGREPHSTVDAEMVSMAGLPSWLVVDSEDRYRAAALRLIENDADRVELSEFLIGRDLTRVFYDSEYLNHGSDFARLLSWLYENHDDVMASGRRVWGPDDRSCYRAGAVACSSS